MRNTRSRTYREESTWNRLDLELRIVGCIQHAVDDSSTEAMHVTKPTLDDFDAVKTVVGALEGFDAKTQERILRWTREKLGLSSAGEIGGLTRASAQPPPVAAAALASSSPSTPPPTTPDIKSFVASKDPKTDSQFAATVAYYYQFEAPPGQHKDSITAEDLQDACRKVGRLRFPRVAQTLINAHAQGLLDRGERGTYTLNTVGENLVAMALPADGSPKPLTTSSSRRAKTKTRSAKKVAQKRAKKRQK
jgi:hypothetical protein